tara:strand:+ start:30667 stop:31212 length:546 start_codon:yes stop_codon:yes gene_type:complete
MIYSFTPYSIEKNFGKAINDCCEIVPNLDDWICIRDGDMMNLTPNWGHIMQETIDLYSEDYKLFGCWTNRLNQANGKAQLVPSVYDEFDINGHYKTAELLSEKCIGIKPVKFIAGLFMLFQKKTWLEAGKFEENTVAFDSRFCKKINGKIGLINRLYVFHLYRIWAKGNPGTETKHLIKTK